MNGDDEGGHGHGHLRPPHPSPTSHRPPPPPPLGLGQPLLPLPHHRRMLSPGPAKPRGFTSLSLFLLLLLSLLYFYFFASSSFGPGEERFPVEVSPAGKAEGGNPVPKLFELRSANGGIVVKISNFGAIITSLLVPDSEGEVADVVLGFDTLEPYINGTSPYFGSVVGRVANRIKDGKFNLDGMEFNLPINDPPNSLHGGFIGFSRVLWEIVEYKGAEAAVPSITLKYHSKDGEQGYPGDIIVTATYSLPSKSTLKLEMEATPLNKATPVNLAQHTYWNLAGHDSGTILDHLVQIWGSQVTPVDKYMIPTGEFLPVKGTPYDFTTEHTVGSRIEQVPGGYDINYVLDRGEVKSGLKLVAKVTNLAGSRTLRLWSDAPGVQFYTGNGLNGVVGKSGAVYGKHTGLCLETQGYPNAVNQPNFPTVVLRPGEKYKHTMLFEFST